ncbi:MAG: MBL fold metallo-hydrolase [Deltaproteobacteria bacterium]|jgi:glyoxylase-like metal-dependent hydrolase (beta-lactamase superfamily II)|nr:MBL fold metallo-hydrolase [Deltaproteobacteria bacterium]
MEITPNLHAFVWESMTTNNCNTYFIDGPTRVLIDPGHSRLFGHVELGLKQLGLTIDAIDLVICTHAHPDHIEGVQLFKDSPAFFCLHEEEWRWAGTIGKQMGAALGMDMEALKPDFFLKEGDLQLSELTLQIIHTPGHSPGSVTLYWPEQKALFTGDLIFKEGFGRTDLPGGDGATLKKSIQRLTDLDVEWLLSGHGDIIAGAEAVRKNFEDIEQFYFAYI